MGKNRVPEERVPGHLKPQAVRSDPEELRPWKESQVHSALRAPYSRTYAVWSLRTPSLERVPVSFWAKTMVRRNDKSIENLTITVILIRCNAPFRIAGGIPKGKVSCQVTGIRQDKWANAHRIQVAENKPDGDRGCYLHPELFGKSEDRKVMPGPRPMMSLKAEERPVRRPSRLDRSSPCGSVLSLYGDRGLLSNPGGATNLIEILAERVTD